MNTVQAYRGLVEGLFRSDFIRFQALWVEEHLRLLQSLRKIFGNDLDKIIIVAMIGQQQLRDPAVQPSPYAPSTEGEPLGNRERFTNVESLASATGIPRESVRRKVNEMIADGWVERVGTRGLAVRPVAAVDMQPATLTAFDMLDKLFAEYAAALVKRGDLRIERPRSGSGQAGDEGRKAGE